MTELAAVRTRGNVGDDVERLPGLEEGGFEREVIARRHEQLMREAALAKNRRQRGEEAVDRSRRRVSVEQRMELVVERTGAFHHGDVLRDSWQAEAVVGVVESLRESSRQLRDLGAEHRDKPAAEECQQHLLEVILRGRCRTWRL